MDLDMWMRHKARIALGDMAFGPFGIWLVIIHVGKFGGETAWQWKLSL